MTQEDKQLLLKDLSARLYYGVKVTTTNTAAEFGVISGISIKDKISVRTKDADIVFDCTEIRPYLRPMSSMTEEEEIVYEQLIKDVHYKPRPSTCCKLISWLKENYFDYNYLIEKGLAIEVTERNNPYEN